METQLPPCGIYRTTIAIGSVPEGRLVMFHNHGDPGPGIYLPEAWDRNRARFAPSGETLDPVDLATTLEPLPAQGLYRVTESFTCCEKNCRTFEPNLLVQLGYNGEAEPILFVPEWTPSGLAFPEVGQPLDEERLARLAPLMVAESSDAPAGAPS